MIGSSSRSLRVQLRWFPITTAVVAPRFANSNSPLMSPSFWALDTCRVPTMGGTPADRPIPTASRIHNAAKNTAKIPMRCRSPTQCCGSALPRPVISKITRLGKLPIISSRLRPYKKAKQRSRRSNHKSVALPDLSSTRQQRRRQMLLPKCRKQASMGPCKLGLSPR